MTTAGALPASMGKRLLAFVIDSVAALVLGGGFVVAGLATLVSARSGAPPVDAWPPATSPVLLVGVALLLGLGIFQWWYQGTRGFTIGKRLVGLRTLSARDGRPVGLGKALVRLLVPAAGALALAVGQVVVYLSPFFDSTGRRQGWHDKAAGTIVYDVAVGIDPATATAVTAPEAARRMQALLQPPQPLVVPEPPVMPWSPLPSPTAEASEPARAPQPVPAPAAAPGPVVVRAPAPAPVVVRAPVAAPVPVPVRSVVPGPAGLGDDVEMTRLRPARGKVPELAARRSVTIQITDGRRLTLDRTALIGRRPAPRPGDGEVELIAVPDPGRSVSKTHLALGVDRSGVWVRDRDSTNGTVVTLSDGQQILCAAEQQVRLPTGASVAFGDYGLTIAE